MDQSPEYQALKKEQEELKELRKDLIKTLHMTKMSLKHTDRHSEYYSIYLSRYEQNVKKMADLELQLGKIKAKLHQIHTNGREDYIEQLERTVRDQRRELDRINRLLREQSSKVFC